MKSKPHSSPVKPVPNGKRKLTRRQKIGVGLATGALALGAGLGFRAWSKAALSTMRFQPRKASFDMAMSTRHRSLELLGPRAQQDINFQRPIWNGKLMTSAQAKKYLVPGNIVLVHHPEGAETFLLVLPANSSRDTYVMNGKYQKSVEDFLQTQKALSLQLAVFGYAR
mgnify:CR=1 FL=1